MARTETLHPEHAAHAAQNPPSPGYTCGSHAETYGGGCFNCGWAGPTLAQSERGAL